MLDLCLTGSKSLINIPHHTLHIVPASHTCCTPVHVYNNVITLSRRHERRQAWWKCQSCWMHQEDIKPVWISHVSQKHWAVLFQTLSLAIKSTTALLKMSHSMKLPGAWDPFILHSDHGHKKVCACIKRCSGASALPKIILLLGSNVNQPPQAPRYYTA